MNVLLNWQQAAARFSSGDKRVKRLEKLIQSSEKTETAGIGDHDLFMELIRPLPRHEIDARRLTGFFLPTIMACAKALSKNKVLIIKQRFEPLPLYALLSKMGFVHSTEKISNDLFVVYFVRKKEIETLAMRHQLSPDLLYMHFKTIDVRQAQNTALQSILCQVQTLPQEMGLKIIQSFEPAPLYGVLEKQGLEHFTFQVSDHEFHVYFIRKHHPESLERPAPEQPSVPMINRTQRVPVVIQSATPVVYPLLLRLLQSKPIKKHFDVREVKVWRETEKHLGWIVNGKADISFSAIIASANLLGKENDVKLATVNVWDNFYLVTRGFKAQTFSDLKDKAIYMPLFRKAPPAQVTNYLMRQFGENPAEYNFVFGQPFGRPEEIAQKLIEGEIDTALIREPEVSYALQASPEITVSFSYSQLWKQLKGRGHGLPNAGLVFKGAFLRTHPQLVQLFLKELEQSVQWVVQNPDSAAQMAYQAMGRTLPEIQLFLQRVHFENIPAIRVKEEIKDYLQILGQNGADKIMQKADELFVEDAYFDL